MNRVHELGKRSGAFGQPREVQPFLIIQNSLRSSFEPISQLPATQPILLILGVNEGVARQYQVLISHPKERGSEDQFDISFKRDKPRAGPYQPRRLASFAMLRAQKKLMLESKHVQEPIRNGTSGKSYAEDAGQRRRLWKRKMHRLMLFQPSCYSGRIHPSAFLSLRSCTFHLVHRPHESDLALYCPPRKLQTTPLRLSDLIDLTFLLGMEGLLTDSETQSSDLDWHTGVNSTLSS
ncbi:hypothetical protein G4B88_002338 (mitochondrion) [Cannabis sativa]|uniref:Uncharacterized protein n=1 Tax=Cannabis sativa TaxID=3483 RepID=A0A7J6DV71_CANSA|nr:hypothetical protein G4B88_002338 [Cannabis sativa]